MDASVCGVHTLRGSPERRKLTNVQHARVQASRGRHRRYRLHSSRTSAGTAVATEVRSPHPQVSCACPAASTEACCSASTASAVAAAVAVAVPCIESRPAAELGVRFAAAAASASVVPAHHSSVGVMHVYIM